ncbi:N-acetyltransferase, partial [Candidatus Parcubacteria bacterium]
RAKKAIGKKRKPKREKKRPKRKYNLSEPTFFVLGQEPILQVVSLDVAAAAAGKRHGDLFSALAATCYSTVSAENISLAAGDFLRTQARPNGFDVHFVAVLIADGQYVGLAGFTFYRYAFRSQQNKGELYLAIFCVHELARNKGFGGTFLRGAEALSDEWLRGRYNVPLSRIELHPMPRSRPFYARNGYKDDPEHPGDMVKSFD